MLSRSAVQQAVDQLRAERAANGVATQGQRQSGLIAPPLAHVENAVQALAVEGELAFVNDEPGLVLAVEHLGNDLVEGNDLGSDIGREQLERQVRRGHGARHGDFAARDFVQRNVARGHDHGPVTLADASAAGHDGVLVLDVRIGVKGDRRDVVEAVHGFAIQGLDIAKRVGKLHPRHANLVGRHAVKHEGVVGVGTVRDRDFANVLGGIAAHRNGNAERCS